MIEYEPSIGTEMFEIPQYVQRKLDKLNKKEEEFKRYYTLAIMNGICPKCGDKLKGQGFKRIDGLFSKNKLQCTSCDFFHDFIMHSD